MFESVITTLYVCGHTFGTVLQAATLYDVVSISQLPDHTAIFLVHQDNLASLVRTCAALGVALARLVVRRVVRRQFLSRCGLQFRRGRLGGTAGNTLRLRFCLLLAPSRLWRLCSLQEGGTLSQYRLEGIDILLDAFSAADSRKLYASECAAARAYIPPRNEVAGWRLMVYLGCCRQREVQLGGEVEMEVEVFLGGACGVNMGRIGEYRTGGHHQQREGLRPARRERLLLAIGDVVRRHAFDGIEQLGILRMQNAWGQLSDSLLSGAELQFGLTLTLFPDAMLIL